MLDSCLVILCRKGDYVKVYEPIVKGKVPAKNVKEELIKRITAPKEELTSIEQQEFQSFIKIMVTPESFTRIEEEVRIDYLNDVNSPFFRNGCGYKGEIDNDKIKKLTVHFYKQYIINK